MNWKPTGDYLIIKKFDSRSGKLFLPESIKLGEGDIFEVVAVGVGFYTEAGQLISYDIQPGDKVMIAGKLLKVSGEKDLFIGRQADVLAKIPESIESKP